MDKPIDFKPFMLYDKLMELDLQKKCFKPDKEKKAEIMSNKDRKLEIIMDQLSTAAKCYDINSKQNDCENPITLNDLPERQKEDKEDGFEYIFYI